VHGEADVVDEDVETPQRVDRGVDGPRRRLGLGEIRADVQPLPDPGCVAPPAGRDARAFGDEELCRLEADPAGRAGDETRLPLQPQIQRPLA
jgi:hypothetical protein